MYKSSGRNEIINTHVWNRNFLGFNKIIRCNVSSKVKVKFCEGVQQVVLLGNQSGAGLGESGSRLFLIRLSACT